MSRRRNQRGSGGSAALGVLLIIGLIIKFIWWILGALAIVVAFVIVRALVERHLAAAAELARARAETVTRADQQHAWVLTGDDRGIYGPEGAKLMHYIDGAG